MDTDSIKTRIEATERAKDSGVDIDSTIERRADMSLDVVIMLATFSESDLDHITKASAISVLVIASVMVFPSLFMRMSEPVSVSERYLSIAASFEIITELDKFSDTVLDSVISLDIMWVLVRLS